MDEAEECNTPERQSDDSATYEPIGEVEIHDVPRGTSEPSVEASQLKRLSESHTTGVPTKRINKEKLHE